ncbi:MAG: aldo/keto reductase [Rhodobacter sp.]|nr:aldo/keto reductase [Rhodobacter sp.]
MTLSRTFQFRDGARIARLGYGAMRLTGQPGNFGPYANWQAGKALLRRAVELGIDHIDTARAYGPLDNERLISDALGDRADKVFVATKGGLEKTRDDGGMKVARNGGAAALAHHIDESAGVLGTLPISLYYLHFPDPAVPIETSVEAIEQARAAGRVERIGVSNVTLAQLRAAQSVAAIDAVQNRFSLVSNERSEGEEMIAACAEDGIAFVPHGPLGANPTKQGAALPIEEAMAWLLELSSNVLLIPGTTSIKHLEENVAIFDELVGVPS